MRNEEIISEIEKYLSRIIEGTSVSIYNTEFVKEGPNRYLRVYIDKDGGVGLDDCEQVSRKLEKVLDENDLIKQSYILEVSSPGINRLLKKETDFARNTGRIVDVKFYKPHKGKNEYQGELKCLENGTVTIVLPDGGAESFPLAETSSVRLSVL